MKQLTILLLSFFLTFISFAQIPIFNTSKNSKFLILVQSSDDKSDTLVIKRKLIDTKKVVKKKNHKISVYRKDKTIVIQNPEDKRTEGLNLKLLNKKTLLFIKTSFLNRD